MTFRWQPFIAAAISCAGASTSAWGAEFQKLPTSDGPDIIAVVGDFTLGDEKKFVDIAISTQNAVVVFQSPGGSLIAGIEIGKAIHLKGFETFVPDGVQCASACALAWLGGRVQLMSDTARVGFHAVYTSGKGQTTVSSAGNALVGAYLNQLGLPTSAVVYITDAPPEGMQWLNFADAQRVGIDVRRASAPGQTVLRTEQPNTPARTEKHDVSQPSLPSVEAVTYDFITRANRPNDRVLLYLEDEYTDQVNYFGKMLAKTSVLADKTSFFRKWPERNYSVRPDTVVVACQSEVSCKAEGVVDWAVSNHASTSTGSATFSLIWNARL